jgi:hypothetical protein
MEIEGTVKMTVQRYYISLRIVYIIHVCEEALESKHKRMKEKETVRIREFAITRWKGRGRAALPPTSSRSPRRSPYIYMSLVLLSSMPTLFSF